MLHRLFALASAVSLVVCVMVCMLWARSSRGDVFSKLGPRGFELVSARGLLTLWIYRDFPVALPFRWEGGGSSLRYTDLGDYSYNGEGGSHNPFADASVGTGHTMYTSRRAPDSPAIHVSWKRVSIPHWPIALLSTALPILWTRRATRLWIARRRASVGRCTQCGYDLRASPHRCPECGAAPAATVA